MKRKASYIGSNILSASWEKIKKRAHDVWDMGTEGERVLALRKKQDTAKVSKENGSAPALQDSEDHFSEGDFVLLFMGGREITAEVMVNVDNHLYLATDDGPLSRIPSEWCKRANIEKSACGCKCGCDKSADGSLGKCKSCLMVGCG